jgi:4-methyl-5(b-hydroxyethyl)-thiazole monophosphate biosynthesis
VSINVVILLADGFEEIEAVATIDTLRRGGVKVVIAGVEAIRAKGANGITVEADTLVADINESDFDAVILPGGYGGTMKLCADGASQALIKSFDAKGKIVAAICTAPLALDAAGVLKAEYTCYPGVEENIKSSQFVDRKVVESGNVITSRGAGTAICFGLYLIEKLVDKATAEAVKSGMLATYC